MKRKGMAGDWPALEGERTGNDPPGVSTGQLVQQAAPDDLGPGIVSTQVLEPGYYWTAREAISDVASVGETLLLLSLHEVHGKLHTVDVLLHPRYGSGRQHRMLVDEFLTKFVPEQDGDAIRAREQQEILHQVGDIQAEMARTQADPQLMIEAVAEDVERKIKEAAREASRAIESEETRRREKAGRLDKIHRRASRRSAAAGNPLVVARAPTGTNLATYIAAGVNESGVAALREEASRQVIVAGAQAQWLQAKTEEITNTLKRLAPFAAEKAQVALARSSAAINRAKSIQQGIKSLDLYTLKGVDVFDICTGTPALSSEPLTLVQGKLFQDEELAVHADVRDNYDYTDQQQFFNALREDRRLVDQIFPTDRCVVSMAVTRHMRSYDNAYESMMANQANQRVYLMVRNGGNVHVVYSSTPSHEAAHRLFPTEDELGGIFTGIDGTKLSLRDVEFTKATADFDDLQLHYKRFLILLCGLDHQHKLMGDFYPAEKSLSFMSLDFQQRYMRFLANDEQAHLLTHQKHPWVGDYIREKNLAAQPGSRVFIAPGQTLREATPELVRRTSLRIAANHRTEPNIVFREGLRLFLACETEDRVDGDSGPTVKVYLDGKADSGLHAGMLDQTWWLCMDDVKASDLHSYIHSRRNRAMGVSYLRLFKRLHEYALSEEVAEAPSRAYLLEQSTTLGGLPEEVARPAVEEAVRNWRAARRGQDLPGTDELAELNTVLDLVVPAGYVPAAIRALIDGHLLGLATDPDVPAAVALRREPLLLTRTGKNRFHLYTTPNAEDMSPYPDVLPFKWARRVTLEPTSTVRSLRMVSETLVWLPKVLPASESVLQEWPQLEAWSHEKVEPIRLRKYAELKRNVADAAAAWGPILKAGPCSGIDPALFDSLLEDCSRRHRANRTSLCKYNYIALPVGIQKSGTSVATIYMRQGAERVLHAYGDESQRERVLIVLRKHAHWRQSHIDEYLAKPVEWSIALSESEIDKRHDMALKNVPECSECTWMRMPILANRRKNSWQSFHCSKLARGDGKPSLTDDTAKLSLNRAVDEVMGASSISNRAHRRKTAREIKTRSLWMDYPDSLRELERSGDTEAFAKARKRWLHERRLEPAKGFPKVMLSPLLWDAQRRRGVGNAYFVGPLRIAVRPTDAEAAGAPATPADQSAGDAPRCPAEADCQEAGDA